MSISRRAALNPAHSHALLLCISSVSGNKIVAAALLRHAQRSARLPCSTPTAVEGGVALKPHACRQISRQSAVTPLIKSFRCMLPTPLPSLPSSAPNLMSLARGESLWLHRQFSGCLRLARTMHLSCNGNVALIFSQRCVPIL